MSMLEINFTNINIYFVLKICPFMLAEWECGYTDRLYEAVSTSFLHVAWPLLGRHPQCSIRLLPLGQRDTLVCVPPRTGCSWQAGAAISVAPNGLRSTCLVHQDEGSVEQTALPRLSVRPRGWRGCWGYAAPPRVIIVLCLKRVWVNVNNILYIDIIMYYIRSTV